MRARASDTRIDTGNEDVPMEDHRMFESFEEFTQGRTDEATDVRRADPESLKGTLNSQLGDLAVTESFVRQLGGKLDGVYEGLEASIGSNAEDDLRVEKGIYGIVSEVQADEAGQGQYSVGLFIDFHSKDDRGPVDLNRYVSDPDAKRIGENVGLTSDLYKRDDGSGYGLMVELSAGVALNEIMA